MLVSEAPRGTFDVQRIELRGPSVRIFRKQGHLFSSLRTISSNIDIVSKRAFSLQVSFFVLKHRPPDPSSKCYWWPTGYRGPPKIFRIMEKFYLWPLFYSEHFCSAFGSAFTTS